MIYVLKFIAAFLLPPGLFVLLGIILSIYLWRQRKRYGRLPFSLSACLTLLLYFSSTLLGAKLLGQPLENRYSQHQPADAQVIVVLGGGSVGCAVHLSAAARCCNRAHSRGLQYKQHFP